MELSLIDQLAEILNKDNSTEVVFVDENGNEISIQEAIKNKIKGTIIERKFSQKEELTKILFGKERMAVEDFLKVVETFERAIYTMWENSGYSFKSKNYPHLKDILSKYNVKEINKRDIKNGE